MRYYGYGLFRAYTTESEDFNEEIIQLEFVKTVYLKLSEVSDNSREEIGVSLKSKSYSAFTRDLTICEGDFILIDGIHYRVNNKKIFRNKAILSLVEK